MTGALAVRPVGRSRVEVSAGRRTSREALTGSESDVEWIGADADLSLGRRWYLLLSGEQNRGDFGAGGTAFLSLSWML